MDGIDVRRYAHGNHTRPHGRRLDPGHIRLPAHRKASSDLSFHLSCRRVAADAFAGRASAACDRRRGRRDLLLVQHADNPGGPQYQDAGHSLPSVGARRARIYLQVSLEQEEMAAVLLFRRRVVRAFRELPGQGQPPADHILPCHNDTALCADAARVAAVAQAEEGSAGTLLRGLGTAAPAGLRRNSHERRQAVAHPRIYAVFHAWRQYRRC